MGEGLRSASDKDSGNEPGVVTTLGSSFLLRQRVEYWGPDEGPSDEILDP